MTNRRAAVLAILSIVAFPRTGKTTIPPKNVIDQEFYETLSDFVEKLVRDLPTSYEAAINALEEKAKQMRLSIGPSQLKRKSKEEHP